MATGCRQAMFTLLETAYDKMFGEAMAITKSMFGVWERARK